MPLFSIGKSALKLLFGRGVTTSYSQFGEDALVQSFFRNNKGVYVDVGAYHPVLYSNTYALYRRGWSGVAIEPNAAMGPLFKFFRPRDTFVCAGVGIGEKTYKTFADGAYNTFTQGTGMKLKSLGELCQEHRISHIDFLNVDVEGMDLEVLQSHDWSIQPTVIAIESSLEIENAAANPIYVFLRARGYTLKGITGKTLLFRRESNPI